MAETLLFIREMNSTGLLAAARRQRLHAISLPPSCLICLYRHYKHRRSSGALAAQVLYK